jgi:hypothetical protein
MRATTVTSAGLMIVAPTANSQDEPLVTQRTGWRMNLPVRIFASFFSIFWPRSPAIQPSHSRSIQRDAQRLNASAQVCRSPVIRAKGWGAFGAQRAHLTAIGRKSRGQTSPTKPKPFAVGCERLPIGPHG